METTLCSLDVFISAWKVDNCHVMTVPDIVVWCQCCEKQVMASTPVDVMELAASYVFIADMPGLKHTDVKVYISIYRKQQISCMYYQLQLNHYSCTHYYQLRNSGVSFLRLAMPHVPLAISCENSVRILLHVFTRRPSTSRGITKEKDSSFQSQNTNAPTS